MKLGTAFVFTLAGAYGLYVLGSFIASVRMADNLEQCQADVETALKNGVQIGRLAAVSNACASTEATAEVGRRLSH